MKNKKVAVLILAAGKGTRMKSETPKVLHEVCGRPMLGYVLDLVKGIRPEKTVAILGYKSQEVRKGLPKNVKIAIQKNLVGSADAVKCGLSALAGFKGTILVLYGDMPLLPKESIQKLLKYHAENQPKATILVATVDKPHGYGRIIRDQYACIKSVVEEKDANDFQKEIKEINTGIAFFDALSLRQALAKVRPNNRKKEYYLTDVFSILYQKLERVESVTIEDANLALGINSRVDLAKANSIMQRRINDEYMKSGVTIVDPATTFISYGVKIGPDTLIYPFTVIERNVKIGNCCQIGPFVHLRQDTAIASKVLLGNFIEVVRSQLSTGIFAKHFCYLGDSRVGRDVNIGAGTVTANFNGLTKGVTVIKDKAFTGANSVLVAPVTIGKNAKVGAGAVVLKNTKVSDNMAVAGVPAKPIKTKTR
ncbi:MAG: NTP transferase domain-containing protein [Candidatus Omnitrophica bacterium]|nr:NTP transferase domain-containing protein [Candidatus Omnitrophota bacterium]